MGTEKPQSYPDCVCIQVFRTHSHVVIVNHQFPHTLVFNLWVQGEGAPYGASQIKQIYPIQLGSKGQKKPGMYC